MSDTCAEDLFKDLVLAWGGAVKITIPKGTNTDTSNDVTFDKYPLTKEVVCCALDKYGSDGDTHRKDADRRRIVGLRRKGREGAKTGFGEQKKVWEVEWPRPNRKVRGANDADSVYLSLASDKPSDSGWVGGGMEFNVLDDAALAQFSDHVKEPGHVRLCWECTEPGCTNVVRLPDVKGCFEHKGKLLFTFSWLRSVPVKQNWGCHARICTFNGDGLQSLFHFWLPTVRSL
jgi:hypothetical protein